MVPEEAIEELKAIVGERWVLLSEEELAVYDSDGLTIFRYRPDVVVLPKEIEELRAVIRVCHRHGIPMVPRGSGTGLSGGSYPIDGGVMIATSRMDEIIEVDLDDLVEVVEPGVVTDRISEAVKEHGLYYPPDPSSSPVSTIGGNIAHNAGGAHCLKYGTTTNHLLGVTVVMPDGRIYEFGGKALERPGYDLTGLICCSDGTLAFVARAIVKLSRRPEAYRTVMAVFDSLEDASRAVSDIIAEGIVPAAMELMDKYSIMAVEGFAKAGFPLDAEAILIIEVDGMKDGLDILADRVYEICKRDGAREVKRAESGEERARWWTGRKKAFGAMGYFSPTYLVEDGVIPRTRLVEAIRRVREVAKERGLLVTNVFHAGDGNLHPLVSFKGEDEETLRRVVEAGEEMLKICVDLGGSISGEHGVGLIKKRVMAYMYDREDLCKMFVLKRIFDPGLIMNPGKVFPIDDPCEGA